MRASSSAYGIKGIFPLVRTLTPQAVSRPFALPALRGVRLAIDATLLVQRLHFADDPHPSRHVIGFYRLITSLRQHDVVPIMVFDHPKKRLALKDREHVKRRHKRELDRIRSRLEHERRGRLQELQTHLDALSELQESERRQVGELLDQWRMPPSKSNAPPPTLSAPPPLPPGPLPPGPLPPGPLPPGPLPPAPTTPQIVAQSMHTNWLQLEETLRNAGTGQSKGQKMLAQAEQSLYETIATQLISGQSPQPLPPLASDLLSTAPSAEVAPQHSLSSLTAMHTSLTKTYARATTPLSAAIYQDCATLSSLMAVPVFWTGDGTRTGGGRVHEAEAYAASLVRAGFADLVASEDSDVLLYEAPLLRGLMGGVRSPGVLTKEGGRGKLEVICGNRVRNGLFPKHDLVKFLPLHPSNEAAKTAEELSYDRLTRSLMLDFALLCGTDFNRTVPGIGPKTALRLLKEHGSISTILKKESKKFRPPDGLSVREYETELRGARMVFLQPPKVRAMARSILGPQAVEAAADVVERQTSCVTVEKVLFSSDASEMGTIVSALTLDETAESDVGAVGAELNLFCTAEPAVESEVVRVATDAISIVGTDTSPEDHVSSPVEEVVYDRQKVHDFLRAHGVFRTSFSASNSSFSSLDEFDYEPAREQEWRDLLDLELGLTTSNSSPTCSYSDRSMNQKGGEKGKVMARASLGADFFGERNAVACWQPHMEQHVREGTRASIRNDSA
uniref:XPG N-terminal domain-containing protein n=1 Tax=Melanopsichium pennsylvanicum 4 TaxID=1398559 RepID=A0A077QYH6_9BASI|nr:conserved hypothetical protein [Melanopsichium pennsylvanicum 4]